MRKKTVYALAIVLMFALFSVQPAAHASQSRPALVGCYEQSCDGYFLHDTYNVSSGQHCWTSLSLVASTYMQNHSHRNVGIMNGYRSNTCSTFYVTFEQIVNNSQNIEIRDAYNLHERNTGDDPNANDHYYSGPFIQNNFNDFLQLGHDSGDCYYSTIEWHDYSHADVITTFNPGHNICNI